MTKVVAVTGCLGFIGRYVTERLLARGDVVYGVDAMTSVAEPKYLDAWARYFQTQQLKFVARDINDLGAFPDIDAVLNLAADTHVDNSISDNSRFVRSNVLGVQHLLEMCRGMRHYEVPTFVQVSTDEVYGSLSTGDATEVSPLNPSSPYAASKAAADLLIQGWGHTYELPWRIVRPSNCYGIGQYPEKLIPKAVRYLNTGKKVPIHETGTATRYWLDVADCADAIIAVLDMGEDCGIYNVGGNTEMSVRGVVGLICAAMGKDPLESCDFQYKRLGLDARYHNDDTKLRSLGWVPQGDLRRDLPGIVEAEKQTFRW